MFFTHSETLEWISTPTTGREPEPRSFHSCTAVGNRVIVFGGRSPQNIHFDDIHIFDVGTKQQCSNLFCIVKIMIDNRVYENDTVKEKASLFCIDSLKPMIDS